MGRPTVSLVLAVVIGLAGGTLARADAPRLVAVMDLGHEHATLPAGALETLEESIRSRTSDLLVPQGYGLLPKDKMMSVLYDNGIDAKRTCDSSCAIESGRELKARYVVEGVVSSIDGQHVAFVRVLDTTTGEVMGTIKLRGATALELDKALDARMGELFEKAGLQRPVRVEPKAAAK